MRARRVGRSSLLAAVAVTVSLLTGCAASPLESTTPAPSAPEHATLHTLAEAELDSAAALGVDLGSTLDVINGVRALQSSRIPGLDEQRIGLVGHSLGGLLILNTMVVTPALIDAAVVLAPASIDPADNVDYLTSKFGGTPDAIVEEYGTPDDNPQFWSAISPGSMVDWVDAPLLIVHGTADEVIPYEWSEHTAAVWEAAGKQVELVPLEGEGHVFQSHWDEAMAVTTAFLERELVG